VELAARKRALRRRLTARIGELAPQRLERAGTAAAESLRRSPALRAARRLALYAARSDELPTRPIFDIALRLDLPCLLPRCLPEGRLEFARIDCWEQLAPGRYDLLEPPAELPALPLERGDLALIPGLGFDDKGHRLGRGAGYYDRTFPPGEPGSPLLCGCALSLQIVDQVPCGPQDRRVELILTELGLSEVRE